MARAESPTKPSGKPPAPSAAARSTGPSSPSAPTGGRTVVVVRPGPPPRKGKPWDLAVGVLGLLLLVASVVLANTMWVAEELPPQYKVSFVPQEGILDRQEFQFESSGSNFVAHEFLFNITEDNVMEIKVNVYFTDDLAASDPDRFVVELVSPDGQAYPDFHELINDPAVPNATNPSEPYQPIQASATYSFGFVPKPQDTVVETDFNATEESVAADQERLNHFNTKGTWKVRAKFTPGNCPTPTVATANTDTAQRAAVCLQANSGRGNQAQFDPGNLFTVGSFAYSYFTVTAERL